jgi:hypothetical protein
LRAAARAEDIRMPLDQTPEELADFRRFIAHLVTSQDGIMLTDEQFWLKAWDKGIELQAAAARRRANRVSDAFTGEQMAIDVEPPIADDV